MPQRKGSHVAGGGPGIMEGGQESILEEGGMETSHRNFYGNSVPVRGNSKCEGPEVRMNLAYRRSTERDV